MLRMATVKLPEEWCRYLTKKISGSYVFKEPWICFKLVNITIAG